MFSVWRFLAAVSMRLIDSMIWSLFYSSCSFGDWIWPTSWFTFRAEMFLADPYKKFISETSPLLPGRTAQDASFLSLLHLLLVCLAFGSMAATESLKFLEAVYFGLSWIFL